MTDTISRAHRESATSRGPSGPSRPRLSQRLRWSWTVLAAVIVVATGAGAWLLAGTMQARSPVLVLERPVPAGHQLAAEDVREAEVAGLDQMAVLSSPEQVAGRTAALPLPEGTLLTPSMIGAPVFPADGQAIAGVTLKRGQFPPHLVAGARVEVLTTAGDTGAATTPGAGVGDQVTAQVLAVDSAQPATTTTAGGGDAGDVVVTLLLAQRHAQQAADAAAAGQIALVELSRA